MFPNSTRNSEFPSRGPKRLQNFCDVIIRQMKQWKKIIFRQNHKNYLNYLPFEIIVEILESLDLKSQICFVSTCRENRKLSNFQNIENIVVNFYKGIAFSRFTPFTNLCIHDNLCLFSKKINKLFLIIVDKIVNLQDIKIDFPNLTDLKLVSDGYVFLHLWKMPLLKSLDITECKNCILDDCCFPLLEEIFIDKRYKKPLRFCNIPSNTKIIRIDEECETIVNAITEFFFEETYAMNAKIYGWKKFVPFLDINCNLCCRSFHIIDNNVVCHNCNVFRSLTFTEINYLKKYPSCIKCVNRPLKCIYMDKYGYGIDICDKCGITETLSRLSMYAAKKISGTQDYPVIKYEKSI